MKSFWGVWLFFIIAACSPLPTVVTVTSTAKDATTTMITSSPIPQVTPSEAPSPYQETIFTPTPVKPTVIVLSPENREVKLSELGFSNTTRLILYYQPSDSIRIMSGQDVRPQRIPNIHPEANIWAGVEISPNKKWFVYPVFTKMQDNIAHYDFWISSIDGKEQKIVAVDAKGATYARWVTDEQIELWYYFGGTITCPQRVQIVNPFTQETLTLPEIPPSTSPQCFFNSSTNPTRSKIIYLAEDGLWHIYDFRTKQDQNVFPWLSETDQFHLWPPDIHWSESGITIALPQQETVDFIVNLRVSNASSTNVAWNKIFLPDGKKIYNETFSWWGLDNELVGFDLVQSDYNYMDDTTDSSPPSNFMILDLKRSILYDYNLDRAKMGDTQMVVYSGYSSIHASADKRFLAWTIRHPGRGTAMETVVLERETGRIARIKGFEFFGWGEVNQP